MYLKDNKSIIETKKTIKERSKIKQALLCVLAIFGGQILGGVILGMVMADFMTLNGVDPTKFANNPQAFIGKDSDKFMMLSLMATVVATFIMYLFAKFYQKRNLNSLGFISSNKLKNYIIGALVGTIMLTAVVLINVLIGHISITNNIANISPIIFILFVIGWIFQGFSEEFMCRSVLMNWLAAEKSVIFGILINSLVFSLLHFANSGFSIIPSLNLFLVGILYSLMFYISDDIFLVGAAHSFWNFVQGNVFGVQVSGNSALANTIWKSHMNGETIMNGGAFGIEGGLICTLVNVIAILVCIKIIRDRKLLVKNK